jgi:hypothetical protein
MGVRWGPKSATLPATAWRRRSRSIPVQVRPAFWRKAAHRRQPICGAIIDAGRSDVPVKDLKFRCTKCNSSLFWSIDWRCFSSRRCA